MARETGIAPIRAEEETCEVVPKPDVSSPQCQPRRFAQAPAAR